MALNFPSSPAVNDTYTLGTKTWAWNGSAWAIQSGALVVLPSNFESQLANRVLAAPDGSAGTPTFRTLVAADIPSLDAAKITSGTIDAARLPSFVDDVLEYVNLAGFPTTGETGKIYVALDTNKTYRWSGSTYVYITSGAVDSVAGKTGVVSLVKGDVGLGNVDNTSDANKPVSTATQTALDGKQTTLVSGTSIKTINSQSILGSGNLEIAGGITSFNTRTGAITLSSSDVTTALGYTPLSNATSYLPLTGGNLTGDVNLPFHTVTAYSTQTEQVTTSGLSVSSSVFLDGAWQLYHNPATENLELYHYGYTTAPQNLLINGNVAVHAGNVGSYAFPSTGGTISNSLTVSNTGTNSSVYLLNNTPSTGSLWKINSYDDGNLYIGIPGAIDVLTLFPSGAVQANGNEVLHAGNYTSYAAPASHTHDYLPLTGGTLTGNLFISVYEFSTSIDSHDSTLYLQNSNWTTGAINSLMFANAGGYYTAGMWITQVAQGNAGNKLRLSTKAASGGGWNTGITIDTAGSVGFGTESPWSQVSILTPTSGNAGYFGVKDATSGGDIRFGKAAGASNTAIAGTWTSNDFELYTNSTLRVTIGAAGAVNVVNALTQGGNQVLHAGNYTSYSPGLTGTGASGTWSISISGNAATATTAANGGVTSVNGQTGAVTVSGGSGGVTFGKALVFAR